MPNSKTLPLSPKPFLCVCLGFTSGFVDTTGFVALFKLFTAHVTGNLILLGAGLAQSSLAGALSRLVVIPLFAIGVLLAFFAARHASAAPYARLRALLLVEAALLGLFLVAGLCFGDRLKEADSELRIIVVAAAAVLAMGVQSAIPRASGVMLPMSNVMTGNLTELTLSIASLAGPRGKNDAHDAKDLRRRVVTAAILLTSFIVGAASAAALFPWWGFAAVVVPVLAISAAAFQIGHLRDS